MADPATSESALTPIRLPSLVERIASVFNRATPRLGPQLDEKQTTETGYTSPSAAMSEMWSQYFQGDNTRMSVYRDVDKMDKGSEEASRALNTISNNATTSEDGTQQSFTVTSENDKVQQELDDLVTRTRLHTKVKPFFRNLVKNGDLFWEVSVNAKLDVSAIKQRPPNSMYRNEDAHGELKLGKPKFSADGKVANAPGECAYEQQTEDGKLLASFWPWQIIHARHDHDDMAPYGKSLFWVARSTWKKLKAMEEGLIIGRLTRDLMKLVFYIDTTGLSPAQKKVALSEFKASLVQRNKIDGKRDNPFSVMTDFYFTRGYIKAADGRMYPQQTSVDVIDPKNSGLHNIGDIGYFHQKYLSMMVVPGAHIGFGVDTAGSVVTTQDVQYVRWLRSIQQEGSIALEQLFDFQLILRGIDPYDPSNAYEIAWPSLKATDEAAAANTSLAYAQRDQIHLQEGVVSVEYIRKHEYGLTDEESEQIDEEIAIAEQKELDNLAAQTAIGAVVQNNVTGPGAQAGGTPPAGSAPTAPGIPSQVNVPSVHRDVDGKRKGDEGRTRDGQRIPPTKSKKGTPPGSGKRKRGVAAENVHLLNFLAGLGR